MLTMLLRMTFHPFPLLCFIPILLSATSELDTAVLLSFKSRIDDHRNQLESWSNSSSNSACDRWKGVKCDEQRERVVELHLSSMHLSCDLSSPHMLLPFPEKLSNLSLAANNFTGPIEVLLNQFINSPGECVLASLDLSANGLSGAIDGIVSRCGATLKQLNLSHNHLAGTLSELEFTSLTSLDLSHNNFSGTFPTLDRENSLRELQLSHNVFTGLNITTAGCTNLIHLDVSFNQINDPAIISSPCMALRELNLASNLFTGTHELPLISTIAPSLQRFDASGNGFSGSIDTISIPSTLQLLDLSSNNLTLGPSATSNLCDDSLAAAAPPALWRLLLSSNSFNGPIPADWILTCTNLRSLDLSSNPGLSGPIPSQLCTRLPDLQELIVSRSNLTGPIPVELCTRCSNLTVLLLSNNNITGSIPPQINRLTRLRWLALSNNRLTGTIPGSIGDLRNLAFLELSNNQLQGQIPDELGLNSTDLVWLDVNSNALTGAVPAPFGLRGQSIMFPVNFLLGGDIIFAMNSPSCLIGLGRLLLVQKKNAADEYIMPKLECKARLYPISSYNLTVKPVSSPVFMDLSFNSLSGGLPEALGDMTDLTMMDLRHNNLTGAIPQAIGHLKSLLFLDLSNNHLSGPLPQALGDLTFLSSINLSSNNLSGIIPSRGQLTTFSADSYQGNPLLCGLPLKTCGSNNSSGSSGSSSTGPSSKLPHNLAHAFVALLICGILILAAAAWWIWWKKKMKAIKLNTDAAAAAAAAAQGDDEPRRMSYGEIEAATRRFSVLIGSGGSAQVFKAQLRDDSPAAVKRLIFPLASHEFLAEIENLGKIRHPNLLPLLGFCAHREDRLLVYPLMSNGNLEQLLANPNATIPWSLRKRIATDTARGLCFLHHTCVPHIVHRDVKSSNVLLDDTWNARLADFGMARLMLDEMSRRSDYVSVTTLWGTPGYVPPEYYQSFLRCTRGGDVYSYGVIVLELLTRKRATGKEFGESNLVGWVRGRMLSGVEVVDSELKMSSGVKEGEEMTGFLSLAMACVDDRPNKRPTMLQLVARLKELSLNNE